VSPSGLSAAALSAARIDLTWADNSNNEGGFGIHRSTDGVNFTLVATVPANTTRFSNTGLSARTRYYYQVRAYNAAGRSGFSNVATALTFAGPGQ
jgi:hypothetical protein